jgi:hypothetical protein
MYSLLCVQFALLARLPRANAVLYLVRMFFFYRACLCLSALLITLYHRALMHQIHQMHGISIVNHRHYGAYILGWLMSYLQRKRTVSET